MRTGLDNSAEISGWHSFGREMIADDVVAGMRAGLIVGPDCATQVRKRQEGAVGPYNNIGI